MSYLGSLPDTTNRQDWRLAMQLVDAETNAVVAIQDARVTLTLSLGGQAMITANSDVGGGITIDEDNVFALFIPKSRMGGLCQKLYDVGIRITQFDDVLGQEFTSQLFVGNITVLEGVDAQ